MTCELRTMVNTRRRAKEEDTGGGEKYLNAREARASRRQLKIPASAGRPGRSSSASDSSSGEEWSSSEEDNTVGSPSMEVGCTEEDVTNPCTADGKAEENVEKKEVEEGEKEVEEKEDRVASMECIVCNEEFFSGQHFSNHVISFKHKVKVEVLAMGDVRGEGGPKLEFDIDTITCNVCQKSFELMESLKYHLGSRPHLEKMAEVKDDFVWISQQLLKDTPFKCTKCKKNFTSKVFYKKHLNSVQHLQKKGKKKKKKGDVEDEEEQDEWVASSEEEREENRKDDVKGEFKCEHCNELFLIERKYFKHCETQKHIDTVIAARIRSQKEALNKSESSPPKQYDGDNHQPRNSPLKEIDETSGKLDSPPGDVYDHPLHPLWNVNSQEDDEEIETVELNDDSEEDKSSNKQAVIDLRCDVCNITFFTTVAKESHIKSNRHLLKVKQDQREAAGCNLPVNKSVNNGISRKRKIDQVEFSNEQSEEFNDHREGDVDFRNKTCLVCRKSFLTNAYLNNHFKSLKHQENVKAKRDKENSYKALVTKYINNPLVNWKARKCNVCNVKYKTNGPWRIHLESAKHLEGMKENEGKSTVKAELVPTKNGGGSEKTVNPGRSEKRKIEEVELSSEEFKKDSDQDDGEGKVDFGTNVCFKSKKHQINATAKRDTQAADAALEAKYVNNPAVDWKARKCRVCNIKFKFIGQLRGHVKSTKHSEAVEEYEGKKTLRLKRVVKIKSAGDRGNPDKCPCICTICNVGYNFKSNLQRHFQSPSHLRKKRELGEEHEEDWVEGDTVYCKPCNLSFPRMSHLNAHNSSRKHIDRMRQLGDSNVREVNKPFVCRICPNKKFEKRDGLKKHFKTASHLKRKQERMKEDGEGSDDGDAEEWTDDVEAMNREGNGGDFKCDMCNIGFSSERYLEDHYASAAHLNELIRQQEQREKERLEQINKCLIPGINH